MIFKDNKPIYLQIVDIICERILSGEYKENERIPAVREVGAQLEVNVNTVVRSFDYLQANSIVYNKRGLGFFVSETALSEIKGIRKKAFMEQMLPEFIKEKKMLGITWEEIMGAEGANG